MRHFASLCKIAAATALASLFAGCAAMPGDPYYDQGGYYPSAGSSPAPYPSAGYSGGSYPYGSYPSTSSSVTVYESPRYIYSNPTVVPVPIYTQRPGYDDWRERRDRQAWEARRRDDERRDAMRRDADRRDADRRADDRRRNDDMRREAERREFERRRADDVQRNANRLPPHPNADVERTRREEAERNRRTWEEMENNRRRGGGTPKPDWR